MCWPDMRQPVFPDGDYSIFLATDLRLGTFGHPWEETLCVFGQPLLDSGVVEDLALPIVRRDGRPG